MVAIPRLTLSTLLVLFTLGGVEFQSVYAAKPIRSTSASASSSSSSSLSTSSKATTTPTSTSKAPAPPAPTSPSNPQTPTPAAAATTVNTAPALSSPTGTTLVVPAQHFSAATTSAATGAATLQPTTSTSRAAQTFNTGSTRSLMFAGLTVAVAFGFGLGTTGLLAF